MKRGEHNFYSHVAKGQQYVKYVVEESQDLHKYIIKQN